MPDYGLRVTNSTGGIIIDSTYRNMSQYDSGTAFNISNGNTTTTWYEQKLFASATSLIPLTIFRPSTDFPSMVHGTSKSGSNYDGFYATCTFNQNTNIDWAAYTETSSQSSDTYGLRIKNTAGSLVYDAGKNYFKIYEVDTITLTNIPDSGGGTGSTQTVTHSGISDPYYILTPPGQTWVTFSGSNQVRLFRAGLIKLSSTQVRVEWFAYANFVQGIQANDQNGYNPTMNLIVCQIP